MNEQSIRLDNLRGGNTPDYVFVGIIDSKALNGDPDLGSTVFKNYGIQDFSLTLNGTACQGFPMRISNDTPIWPYYKFYDVLGRTFNPNISGQTKLEHFKDQVIYAHKFEGEETTQGWIGVSMTHSDPAGFTEQYSLGKHFQSLLNRCILTALFSVVWSVYNVTLTVDKYHMVEKTMI